MKELLKILGDVNDEDINSSVNLYQPCDQYIRMNSFENKNHHKKINASNLKVVEINNSQKLVIS